jgi:hypothetical protein
MTVLPLLVTLTFLPGIEFLEPIDVLVENGVVGYDEQIGSGQLLGPGRSAKLEFELYDGLGRLLQSSSQRGQQVTYVPGSGDLLLDVATLGMAEGSARRLWFSPDRFPAGIGSLVPPQTELMLQIRAVR